MSDKKRFLALVPAWAGLLVGLAVMMSGKWFIRWEYGGWCSVGYPATWLEAPLGYDNNLLILLVFPAMGAAFGSWIGWMWRMTRTTRWQARWAWILFAAASLAWLALVLTDTGHNIGYKAFVLCIPLLLRAIAIHCRRNPPQPATATVA